VHEGLIAVVGNQVLHCTWQSLGLEYQVADAVAGPENSGGVLTQVSVMTKAVLAPVVMLVRVPQQQPALSGRLTPPGYVPCQVSMTGVVWLAAHTPAV
jgi:hypothetical protein